MSNCYTPFSGAQEQNVGKDDVDNESLKRRVEEVEYRNEILRAENKALKDMITKVNKKLGERNKALEAENRALKQKVLDRNSRLEFEARQLKDRLSELAL
jgi:regulator of replication initiation timing